MRRGMRPGDGQIADVRNPGKGVGEDEDRVILEKQRVAER
jgi:hypothetical protein